MVSLRRLAAASLLAVLAAGCVTAGRAGGISSPYAPDNPGSEGKSFLQSIKKAAASVVQRSPADVSVYRDVNYISKDDPTSLNYKPGPIGASVYTSAAALMEKRGDLAGAISQYQRALEKEPHNRNALIGLGRLYHRTGHMNEAISTYQTALRSYGDDAVIMNDLGLCYARHGSLDDAIAMLHSAVQRHPDRAMYRNNLATVLVEAGRLDEAHAHLARAYGEAVAYYNVAYLLSRQGKSSQALGQVTKALQLDPNLQPAHQLYAQLSGQLRTASAAQPQAEAMPVQGPSTIESRDPPMRSPVSGPDPLGPAAYRDHGVRIGPFGYVPRSPQEKADVRQPTAVQQASYEEPAVPDTGFPAWPIRMPVGRTPASSVGYVPPSPAGAATQPWSLPPTN